MLAENQQLFNTYRGKNENDPVYTAWRQNETHDMIERTQEAHDSGSKWCKRNIEEAHDTQGRQDSFVRGWIVWNKRNTRQDSFDSGWWNDTTGTQDKNILKHRTQVMIHLVQDQYKTGFVCYRKISMIHGEYRSTFWRCRRETKKELQIQDVPTEDPKAREDMPKNDGENLGVTPKTHDLKKYLWISTL